MKKFVAIYLGSAEGLAEWKATDDKKRKEREKAGMEGWMKWAKDNEASIVALGSPLGKTKRIDAVEPILSVCRKRRFINALRIYPCSQWVSIRRHVIKRHPAVSFFPNILLQVLKAFLPLTCSLKRWVVGHD
jgi:hypothetical protein